MTIDVPHYIPAFIWRFWLSAPGRHGPHRGPRVHIYDVDSSNLSETTRIPKLGHSHSIFHDISCAFSPNSRAILDKAEREFLILQSQAEDALQQLIDAIDFSTTPDTTRIPISPSNLSTIIKFFVFLRFRNGPHYQKIVQELMEPADFQISTSLFPGTKGNAVLSVYSPLFRQVRLQTILEVFCKFFQVSIWDMKPSASTGANGTTSFNYTPRVSSSHAFASFSDCNIRNDTCLDILNKHCWQYSREAEVCLGIAIEEDREFILPECCFGVLDESFGGGIKESESFDCFFPILPTLALYILLDEDKSFDDGGTKFPSFIEVGIELELDIHLRNAMILCSVPPDPEGDNLELSGPKLFFSSLPSIVRSISSYDEFRCRWMSDNFIDYSRLKQRCRQKFGMEGLKKMWTLNRNVVLSDLTDEVEVIGQHPVAFGAFSDVWMGRWYDSVESKQRVVAIKYLRQVMVQNVREKLFKRLQAELLTWHQLCHRNLATLYGIMQSSTSIGMVSAWCDNGTISDYLEKKPDADRLKLIIQVASGVAYLHHFNPPVVHGDLKGGNILVNSHEQAVITDFGLSKVMEDLSSLSRSSMSERRRSTSTSFFAGSTRWMAPELLLALVEDEENGDGPDEDKIVMKTEKRAPRVTTASDVYAFASVCLEIVTGNLPYPHRKNDYSVTVDILRGVSPARGSDLQNALKHMLGTTTSLDPSPNSDGELMLVAGEKVFRDILERCWDGQSVMRPTMEEVLMRLNSEV
ncbi:kinase-like domain-containing protein [Lentinula detonsa]|uniref:Kinase-like domain-containing protein n=1 Tax=Lentinula detonsa TaxID=2804962 RepID=A0A9W8P110_9AGAR|nr:kinase-like domain-containing protein [Lentinula detonsa]